jgi:hypothetical protein
MKILILSLEPDLALAALANSLNIRACLVPAMPASAALRAEFRSLCSHRSAAASVWPATLIGPL